MPARPLARTRLRTGLVRGATVAAASAIGVLGAVAPAHAVDVPDCTVAGACDVTDPTAPVDQYEYVVRALAPEGAAADVVDPQTNLTAQSLDVSKQKGTFVASAVVANSGDTAQTFEVQLLDNGVVVGTRTATLAPGESTGFVFTFKSGGPTQIITLRVDPTNAVAESNEADNELTTRYGK